MNVNCPTCQTSVEWSAENVYRPFCSKKCQLIDLGEWANEEKVIAGKQTEDAEQPLDIEEIEAMLADQPDSFFK
ncbi:DNA gyrase inhibitor YacG [Aestuariibacter salexigens]|uniref:DNA gyrase inhibitor YacG n=1 Tax=Aestuariibacter salexigens TaxID=226010 RepID=UPI000417D387|nr:DNA gyrase inhibitor YacG [Aestuariibacter salexigens]